jgi:hypothetical protein
MPLERLFVPAIKRYVSRGGRKHWRKLLKLNEQLSNTTCHRPLNSIELGDARRGPLKVSRLIEAG